MCRKLKRGGGGSPAYLLAGILAGVLVALLAGCTRPVPASVDMMDEAEARWQRDPVAGYHIVVDVERPDPLSGSVEGDRRRNELTVRQGEIVAATVRYWNVQEERWGEPHELNPEQAYPFTVPGLFDMVRGELRDSGRVDVRVVMAGEPAFPHRIVLGPVWQDQRRVPGTQATVVVQKFEPLVPSDAER